MELFLDAEPLEGNVWDPACGTGTIPKACLARGYEAAGSDVADRGFGVRLDFLRSRPQVDVDNIVSNPPYKLLGPFLDRALSIAERKVAVIVGAKFVYSQGRYPFFLDRPPTRIYYHSFRPSMPPGEAYMAGKMKAEGGSTDYCWLVWDQAHAGPTTCHWLGDHPDRLKG